MPEIGAAALAPAPAPASAARGPAQQWYNLRMRGVNGLHHITAIAGPAQENLDFYAGVLGMRLVKRSVNQDDPGTYHLFYADAEGHPGIGPDVLSVGRARAVAARPRPRDGGRARGAGGQPRLLGRAARALRRAPRSAGDAIRRTRSSPSPIRTACTSRWSSRRPVVRSRRGTAARCRPNARFADCYGAQVWERDAAVDRDAS